MSWCILHNCMNPYCTIQLCTFFVITSLWWLALQLPHSFLYPFWSLVEINWATRQLDNSSKQNWTRKMLHQFPQLDLQLNQQKDLKLNQQKKNPKAAALLPLRLLPESAMNQTAWRIVAEISRRVKQHSLSLTKRRPLDRLAKEIDISMQNGTKTESG